ncbi:ankyrin repeat-containing protein bda1 [Quercus suber]|uniref:Ankyrin repeat-containing protein bda1 n=1 Tax=Quercus suber TaxID=58331 RepID=A0AAW0K0M6_QUESU
MASTGEKRGVYKDHESNGKLYEALLKEDTKAVLKLCADMEEHALHILTIHEDTVLHKAAYSKQADLVLSLLKDLPSCHDNKLGRKNRSGNTILHEAATLDQESSVKVAEEMIKRDQELLRMRNELGETPLFRAARYGKTEIFNFLADESLNYGEKDMQKFVQRNDKTTILHIAILSQHFGLALEIATHGRFKYLVGERDEDGMTALQLLSCNPKAFIQLREATNYFHSSKVKMCCSSAETNDISKEKFSHESALELAKLLVKEDTSWEITSSGIDTSKPRLHKYGSTDVSTTNENVDNPDQLPSSISLQQVPEHGGITPLFLATKSGCIEIVREILEIYPQAVEHIDNEGRTILHVAIKYRQLEVFKLVLTMEVAMRWLVRRLDNDGNSILHMVGIKRDDYVPEKLRGPALELQEEEDALLWQFSSRQLPLPQPTQYQENTGVPVLLNHSFFVVFTATDVLSLTCALTSVVIFLSILTAPFRLEDFKHSLPNKLMLGFTFLFLSVSMMMIAFSATIILMIRSKERWTKILLYSFLSFQLASLH